MGWEVVDRRLEMAQPTKNRFKLQDMMSNTWQSESGVVGANDSEYEQRYIVEASERDVYNLGPNENFGASGIGRRTSVQEQLDESLKV